MAHRGGREEGRNPEGGGEKKDRRPPALPHKAPRCAPRRAERPRVLKSASPPPNKPSGRLWSLSINWGTGRGRRENLEMFIYSLSCCKISAVIEFHAVIQTLRARRDGCALVGGGRGGGGGKRSFQLIFSCVNFSNQNKRKRGRGRVGVERKGWRLHGWSGVPKKRAKKRKENARKRKQNQRGEWKRLSRAPERGPPRGSYRDEEGGGGWVGGVGGGWPGGTAATAATASDGGRTRGCGRTAQRRRWDRCAPPEARTGLRDKGHRKEPSAFSFLLFGFWFFFLSLSVFFSLLLKPGHKHLLIYTNGWTKKKKKKAVAPFSFFFFFSTSKRFTDSLSIK